MSAAGPVPARPPLVRRLPRSLTPRTGAQAGVLCLVLVVVIDLLLRHEHGASGDEPFYLAMAAHPGRAHTFPYAYRVFLPWLVHALPLSHPASFRLIAWLALGAAGGALFALLRDFGLDSPLATGLTLGTLFSPTLLVALLRGGRSVDPLSTLTVTLGCLLIVRRRRLALAIVLGLGVAVKETTAFLLPLAYAVWAERPVDRSALRDALLVGLGPVAVYLALRLTVPSVGSTYTPEFSGSFLQARWTVLRRAFSGVELRRLGLAFGPLWLAWGAALRRPGFARRGLVLVALCVASLSVSFDAGRVLFIAAPVIVVSAGLAVARHRRAAAALVVCLGLLDVGYGVYMEAYGLQHGIDDRAVALAAR